MANLVTYAKQKWEDAKTAITAARLNNMENGISNCAAQINALGDSVSRIDKGACVRVGQITNSSPVIHLSGGIWQAYLLLGQAGTIAVIDAKGDNEPAVTKISGCSVTAKRGSANGVIDITIDSSNISFMVISYSHFAVTPD